VDDQGQDAQEPAEKPTVYVVALHGWDKTDIGGVLMTAEHGALGGHVSSSLAWLERDLTTGSHRAKLDELYPGGWTVRTINAIGGEEIPAEIQKWLKPAPPADTEEETA
jgi:hypothetical protein